MTRLYSRFRRASSLLAAFLLLAASPAFAQISGDTETGDFFGSAVATGDFDNDGFDDVAIGAEGEDDRAGGIHVIYGTASRLDQNRNNFIVFTDRTNPAELGASVTVGDFNGDGFDDIAAGAPGFSTAAGADAGAVAVLYGSGSGITTTNAQFLTQTGLSGDEANDRFGAAVSAGDYNGDGRDDLAIGIPGEDLDGPSPRAGAVSTRYGSASGLASAGEQVWHQDRSDVHGSAQTGDLMGSALASADFNGDGRDDLVIGVPGDVVDGANDAGTVLYMAGTPGGLVSTLDGGSDWNQNDSPSTSPEQGDRFGYSFAAGDFNGDGFADLAVGSPFEDYNSIVDAGWVDVFFGGPGGIGSSVQSFIQDSIDPGSTAADDLFGRSLAAGRFGNDGFDDLAIGVPHDRTLGSRVGEVDFIYGGSGGLGSSVQRLLPNAVRIGGAGEDQYGHALAAGDFNGDGRDDLAVGVPGKDANTFNNAGGASILYSTASAVVVGGNQYFYQGAGLTPTAGEAAPNDGVLALHSPAPNPFRGRTTVGFDLATAGAVRLSVYTLLGQEVAVLASGERAAGAHEVTFDAAGLAAGIYIARLESEGDVRTTRLVLMR